MLSRFGGIFKMHRLPIGQCEGHTFAGMTMSGMIVIGVRMRGICLCCWGLRLSDTQSGATQNRQADRGYRLRFHVHPFKRLVTGLRGQPLDHPLTQLAVQRVACH